jgi:hypothetical protein
MLGDGETEAFEAPITPMEELHVIDGTRLAPRKDFEQLSADVPHDDEG